MQSLVIKIVDVEVKLEVERVGVRSCSVRFGDG